MHVLLKPTHPSSSFFKTLFEFIPSNTNTIETHLNTQSRTSHCNRRNNPHIMNKCRNPQENAAAGMFILSIWETDNSREISTAARQVSMHILFFSCTMWRQLVNANKILVAIKCRHQTNQITCTDMIRYGAMWSMDNNINIHTYSDHSDV